MNTPPSVRRSTPPSPVGRSLCALVALLLGLGQATDALELELLAALPIRGLENAQPSGLTMAGGVLFAVSDKHDHAICRIDIRDDGARLEPFITFNAPWSGTWATKLDFEGLAFADGSFYLVSESCLRVLHVNENGGGLDWITPNVGKAATEAGLFGVKNAHLEGIALFGPRRILLAVEREPRGLIEVSWEEGADEDEPQIKAWATDETMLTLPEPRAVDFADLHLDGGGLYALVRNADAVVPIEWSEGHLEELDEWSFRHVVEDSAYAYSNQTFGKAEGLAMDDERVYIVLDNNGQARLADDTDTRSQLLIFTRPD
ncbi:MAG TPA: esterase-like activity of phytase family protein [Candidatus Latescibacteria bacterium]|nr:esterase-like activity of phytase family protein [Candidatus Latescibacterota bacterium]HJN30414.1 esterase-like activity of phytase family protein [Candidatus Latescibacterota bacterium]